jgi:hypothetical protein
MWLSGRPGSAPLLPPGDPAGLIDQRLAEYVAASKARTGTGPREAATTAGSRLLGERAAIAGLARRAPFSAGGAFRAAPTSDGWLGLSLARPDDIDLLPALVEGPVGDPWETFTSWAGGCTSADGYERATLLGLPAARWPPEPATRTAIVSERGGRRTRPERPLVVDLTSLWSGPLCAHLLGLAGCRVVKVESTRRLDGARHGPAAFYDLLHAGHDSVTLDFTDADDRRRLADLLRRADLVLEASRPRALQALGLDARDYVDDGISWLSITARGRASNTVGFGDDVAVSAGLAVTDGPDLLPLGDALADPLSGVAAAAAAALALLEEEASLIDVSMLDVAREAVGPLPDATVLGDGEDWWVESAAGRHLVAAPSTRQPAGRAAAPGEHNGRWLR